MKPRTWLLPATIAALVLVAMPRASADEFYKGKTITFVVGFSAGGGFDTYTRLIARHFGKHVPGNPTVVVENRTGAGSLIAANYIFHQAPRDGTVIGNWIGPLVLQQVLGNKAAKFDGRQFGWLGVPTPDSGVCALTQASGIKTMDDWFKSERPIKIGGTAPGSTTDDVPKLLQAALGLPMKLVEGYQGTSKVRLAAESGEIDGGCWAWESIKPTWAKGLQSGEVHIVLQTTEKSASGPQECAAGHPVCQERRGAGASWYRQWPLCHGRAALHRAARCSARSSRASAKGLHGHAARS